VGLKPDLIDQLASFSALILSVPEMTRNVLSGMLSLCLLTQSSMI